MAKPNTGQGENSSKARPSPASESPRPRRAAASFEALQKKSSTLARQGKKPAKAETASPRQVAEPSSTAARKAVSPDEKLAAKPVPKPRRSDGITEEFPAVGSGAGEEKKPLPESAATKKAAAKAPKNGKPEKPGKPDGKPAPGKTTPGGTGQFSTRQFAAGRAAGSKLAVSNTAATRELPPLAAKPGGAKPGETGTGTAVFSSAQVRAGARAGAKGRTAGFTLADARDWRTATSTFSGAAVRAAALQQTEKPNYNAFRKRKTSRFTPLRTLGNLFYSIGFTAEYRVLQVWRFVRDALIFVTQLAIWMFGSVGGWIAGLVRGFAKDFTAPLRRFQKRRRQLRRLRERARKRAAGGAQVRTFMGVGVKHSLQFLLNVLGVLMPAAAAVVLVVTVSGVVNTNYALEVQIDGEVLGYVADQSVVEGAKGLLRDRIRLAPNQEISDWQLNPTYSIAWAGNLTTTQQLVNAILRSGAEREGDIVQATGLYVGNQLVAVTTEGEHLRAYLDELLEAHKDPARPDAEVRFVKDITFEPNQDDVYFASSVMDYQVLMSVLNGTDVAAQTYQTHDGETLEEIAFLNGITLDQLLARNPEYMGQPGDFVPEDGIWLLIRRATPYLQVQVSYLEQSVETIPYETIENQTEDLPLGRTQVVQEGADGQREVWDQLIFIDGELDRTVRQDDRTVVLAEAVPRIVNVGRYDYSDYDIGDGTPGYVFPVPDSVWSSRGYAPGGHRGLDINAPTGTPIFACQEGTVVTAGWHWSYGYHVVINHPDGYTTLYGHCSSLAVEAGQTVTQGQYIGAVGSTGVSTGPHCHLEVQRGGALTNPLSFVSPPEGYSFGYKPAGA